MGLPSQIRRTEKKKYENAIMLALSQFTRPLQRSFRHGLSNFLRDDYKQSSQTDNRTRDFKLFYKKMGRVSE